jgi:hypothetical protein
MNQDLLDGAYAGKSPMDVKFFGICVAACPVADSHICEYSKSGEPAPELYVDEFQDKGPCWYVPLKSSNIFFRCLPLEGVEKNSTVACKKPGGGYRNPETDPSYFGADGKPNKNCKTQEVRTVTVMQKMGQPNPLLEQAQQFIAVLARWAGDIQVTIHWAMIVAGGGGVCLGFVWLLLLKHFAKEMVWFVCYAVVLLMAAMSLVLCFKGGLVGSGEYAELANKIAASDAVGSVSPDLTKSTEDKQMYEALAIVASVATVMVFVLIIFMRKKVAIAIGG